MCVRARLRDCVSRTVRSPTRFRMQICSPHIEQTTVRKNPAAATLSDRPYIYAVALRAMAAIRALIARQWLVGVRCPNLKTLVGAVLPQLFWEKQRIAGGLPTHTDRRAATRALQAETAQTESGTEVPTERHRQKTQRQRVTHRAGSHPLLPRPSGSRSPHGRQASGPLLHLQRRRAETKTFRCV